MELNSKKPRTNFLGITKIVNFSPAETETYKPFPSDSYIRPYSSNLIFAKTYFDNVLDTDSKTLPENSSDSSGTSSTSSDFDITSSEYSSSHQSSENSLSSLSSESFSPLSSNQEDSSSSSSPLSDDTSREIIAIQSSPIAATSDITMVTKTLFRSVFNGVQQQSSDTSEVLNFADTRPRSDYGTPLTTVFKKKHLQELSQNQVLSPMSSLAVELNSANLRDGSCFTPPSREVSKAPGCKSLDSKRISRPKSVNLFETSRRSLLSCSLHDSIKASTAGVLDDFSPLCVNSPPRKTPSSPMMDKENVSSSPGMKFFPLSSTKKKPILGSSCTKSSARRLNRRSPLKDISNANRSLQFTSPSPIKRKASEPISLMKPKQQRKEEQSPLKELEAIDANSRDSGFSESGKKFDLPLDLDYENCAPRKLNLDCTNSTAVFFISPSKQSSSLYRLESSDVEDESFSQKQTKISPDNLVSQDSNFPTNVLRVSRGLPSILTDSGTVDEEDDYFMHELYTVEESEEDDLEEKSNFPCSSNMDALFSGTVQMSRSKISEFKKVSPPQKVKSKTPIGRRPIKMLASNMEVSPFNPQARVPIRRALSLMLSSSTDSNNEESQIPKFKRPLPPSAPSSPHESSKRHKLSIPGTTPTFPRTKSLLPVTSNNSEESDEDSCLLNLTDLKAFERTKSTPVLSKCHSERSMMQTEASPELPGSKASITETLALPPHPASLELRQFSTPVTSGLFPLPTPFGFPSVVADKSPLPRAHSENDLSIMKALERSQHKEEMLTGDFKTPLCLPTVTDGRHPDLSAIGPETLAKVIRGEYDDKVASYKILDCRYSYEFEGGHIVGAESWNTPQCVVDFLESAKKCPPQPREDQKRHILVFHCEFSAERGPRAQRLLRELDRTANKESYPALHFPEIYLLEGGYKSFFENHSGICDPKRYTKMRDTQFSEDLKACRAKSKTWAAENKQNKGRTAFRLK